VHPHPQHHGSGFHFWLKPITNKLPSILSTRCGPFASLGGQPAKVFLVDT